MPANKPLAVLGMAASLVLAAVPAFAADAAPPQAAQCFACHGSDGLSKMPDAPNLAGQNESYLVKALKDFRSGKRENEMMSLMAKNLSDQDINTLAHYFSSIEISVKKP